MVAGSRGGSGSLPARWVRWLGRSGAARASVGERADGPPDVAIISNSYTPYRANLHGRIARELREIRLHSIFTSEISNHPWQSNASAEIQPVYFGPGETAGERRGLGGHLHELRKSSGVVRYLRSNHICAAVVCGYHDLGLLRTILACRRSGIAVLMFTDSNILADNNRGLKRMVKWVYVSAVVRLSAAVLVAGTAGQRYYQRYGARLDQIFLFPFDPDYSQFQPSADGARVALAPPVGRRRRLVYTGRLAPEKRVDLLLDAFAAIAADRPDWDLLIIGDGPLRAALECRISPELSHRVTWAGFIDETAAIAELFRASDALVLPSDFEPWGIVVTEAASSGLALVCSDVVGSGQDVLLPGVNGFRFRAGSVPDLVRALLDVTDDASIDRYRASSVEQLRSWRRATDPVDGLRAALRFLGVVPAGDVDPPAVPAAQEAGR